MTLDFSQILVPPVTPLQALLIQAGLFLSVLLLFSSSVRWMQQAVSKRRVVRFLGDRVVAEASPTGAASGAIPTNAPDGDR